MKWMLGAVLVVLCSGLLAAAALTETCFGTGEKTDGMNKICFYSCPSGDAAITISSVRLCPLSIKR